MVYHREVQRAAHLALALLATTVAWGCEVQTPVVMSAQATDELTECGFCDNPTGAEPEMPSEAFIDTVVITTHQLADEIDCRGCVELDECGEPHQRDCVCLDSPIRLSELDLGAILSEYSVENVSRDEEYCVSVATALVNGSTGPDCNCEPRDWGLPRRSIRSCTYSRRAKRPGDELLLLNQNVCQNPVGSSVRFLPPVSPGNEPVGRDPGQSCVYADFFAESLEQCLF